LHVAAIRDGILATLPKLIDDLAHGVVIFRILPSRLKIEDRHRQNRDDDRDYNRELDHGETALSVRRTLRAAEMPLPIFHAYTLVSR
jgi:hypothetical protein